MYVNDQSFTSFRHRMPPQAAAILSFWGKMQPFKLVIKSPVIVLDMLNLYWRQLGGHLRRVETCKLGVTWGIAYDHTPWVYTGGWGGGFLGTLDSNMVQPMTDTQDYRVYENQRWNPLTGYSSAGIKCFHKIYCYYRELISFILDDMGLLLIGTCFNSFVLIILNIEFL